ncbi:MAG: hypothetical protein HOP20_05755 [Sulfuriferula sp.]|nr:hypothetical protein [Sulfuriferula sp.]
MAFNFEDHYEPIKSECESISDLTISAYKLDGDRNSLKWQLGCYGLKSCDYVLIIQEKITLIEISDLSKQFSGSSERLKKIIKAIPLEKSEIKALSAKDIMINEIVHKYIHSLIILHELGKHESNYNFNLENMGFIVAHFSGWSDIQALDHIKRSIKDRFQGKLTPELKIIPFADLENLLRTTP